MGQSRASVLRDHLPGNDLSDEGDEGLGVQESREMRGALDAPLEKLQEDPFRASRQEAQQRREIASVDVFLADVFPEKAQLAGLKIEIMRRGGHEGGVDRPDRGAAMNVELALAEFQRQRGADVMQHPRLVSPPGSAAAQDQRQSGTRIGRHIFDYSPKRKFSSFFYFFDKILQGHVESFIRVGVPYLQEYGQSFEVNHFSF